MSVSPDGTRSLLPLTVRGLSHSIDGTLLLHDVELEHRASTGAGTRAECIAVMGPNGAGKSLLLRLLNGLLAPSAGEILWNGMRPDADVRRRQALVFQKPVLLRRSVRANVEFVLKLGRERDRADRRARADALLDLAGLADRARMPARRLSGGEQQRLALVCALANAPEVLLLDEPTASLDPASTAAIETLVADAVAAGTTALLVTHDAGQARRLADSVVFMANGRVTEHTTGEAFFAAPRSSEARDYLAGRLVVRRLDDGERGAPFLSPTGARTACP